jgi:ketosteroid isomerase-like protein
MKKAIFAVALLTLGCFSSAILAQQQDLQEVMDATKALGARERELLSKKDAAGIASLFTSDGLLVMLAPQFAFKPGRDAIQKYYQGIIDAGASNISLELKNLELRGNDGVWSAGNYSIIIKDRTIRGSWFRILKRENGTWKSYGGVRARWCCRCSRRFVTSTHDRQIDRQPSEPLRQ